MTEIMKSNQKMTTQKLVEKAQAGDRAAFGELAERFRGGVGAWLRPQIGAHLRTKIELDDVLQDAFVWAFKSIHKLQWKGEEAFDRWLCSIAKHVLLKAVARENRQPVLRLEQEVTGSAPSPSRGLRRDERFNRLERALRNLSEDHRQVIRLARIEGVPVKEIAQRMGRSPDAVSQLLIRALRKLRESFGDTESLSLPARNFESETDNRDDN